MKVESIIYIYGAVCVSMIVFNIAYNIILNQSESSLKKRCEIMKKQIYSEFGCIKKNGRIEQKHLRYMQRSLSQINNLIAFERAL